MTSTRRPRLQTLAAGLLALDGATTIIYGGFRPMPPISDVPVPLAWEIFGAIELAAAFGVFRQQTWGRALGVVMVVLSLALAVFLSAARGPGTSALGTFVSLGLGMAYGGFILWLLLRRWQGPD